MFGNGRQIGTMHMKIGFKDNGELTAIHSTAIEDAGINGKANRLNLDHFGSLKLKNYKSESRSLYTNTVRQITNRGYRWGPGILSMTFEAVSAELGMDPIDVMLKNFHTPEPSLKACADAGKPIFGWDWHPANSKKLPNGKMHGLGTRAAFQCRFGTYACIYMYMGSPTGKDGKIYIPFSTPYLYGGASRGVEAVVAEEVGAKYEDVIATFANYNDLGPNTALVGGSHFPSLAFAAKEAALDLKEQLCKAGASSLKVTLEEVDIKDSTVYVKADPSKSVAFIDLKTKNYVASWCGSSADWGSEYKSDDYGKKIDCMSLQFCEVEVDTDTGQVEIIKLLGVPDAGKCINPTSWNSQIEGLLIWTIGTNMSEDYIYDKETGVLLNGNALEYKIPTLLECPIEHHTVETRNGGGAYGSTGTAEFFHDYVVVALAVHNAIGKWVSPPVTPEKVLKALGKA